MDDAAPIRAGSAAWWIARTENADDRPRRRRMLSLVLIADTALSLLDTEGAEALTMRRLAQRLQCSQAALYRHVTSRDELLVVAMDRAVVLGLPSPPEGLDWRRTAEWQAHAFRDFLLAHPALVAFMRGTERLSPSSLAGLEFALGQFTGIGLSLREAYATASAFATFVVGSVQFNLGVDTADPQEQRMRQRLYEGLDPHRHPIMVAHAEELSRMGSREEFEFGLAALLDGVEARIAR
ncbi:TetR/AcrR family transcriptional regulator [Actinomadura sp. DC4]|uniref:TetR/AcrR family transcriptional regulator n=1 Tax=Actinomadura sp. DC4 TaxID=3055069 RepID=UPI0025B276FA|nr:TetR/AcrR family transcriptional regulator [Actinomadura sp. DC4]MDN3357771.1 TetR/AcrR family transcriptional regulator [Actinomadura sp. DC4]